MGGKTLPQKKSTVL